MLKHLNLRAGDTLLDYGCGPGRLIEFLHPNITYYGLDWSPVMRDRVTATYPGTVVFSQLPAERRFTHTTAIGTFNLDHNWNAEETLDAVNELWDITKRSLVVSLYRGDDTSCIAYEPEQLVKWARLLGAKRFCVDGTHLDNDLLLAMHR